MTYEYLVCLVITFTFFGIVIIAGEFGENPFWVFLPYIVAFCIYCIYLVGRAVLFNGGVLQI